MTTTQDALPPRLRTAYIAISEFPSTNGIKVVALALVIATGVVLAGASAAEADVSEATLGLWLSALLAMLGIGSWQQKMKRDTPQQSPPAAPDIEDVSATTGTPAPKPAPARVPMAVTALQSSAAARAADPGAPIGTSVPGEGD